AKTSSLIRIVGMLSTSLLTSQVACSHVCLLGVKSYRRTVYAAASPGSALSQSQHWPARPRLTSWIRRYITLIERRTHTSPAPRFCQTNSTLRRPSVYPLRRRQSVDRPSGPRAPISAKQTRALSERALAGGDGVAVWRCAEIPRHPRHLRDTARTIRSPHPASSE